MTDQTASGEEQGGIPLEILKRLGTNEGVDAFVDKMFETIREAFATDGFVAPGTLVLHTRDPNTGESMRGVSLAMLLPEDSNEDHVRSPAHVEGIKQFVKDSRAVGVFQSQMMRMLVVNEENLTDDPDVDALLKVANEEHGELSVFVYFEHIWKGVRVWLARVMEEDGKRSLSEFEALSPEDAAVVFPPLLTHLN